MQAQHKEILLNTIQEDSLLSHEYFNFQNQENINVTDKDEENWQQLAAYKVIVFLGTWCSDSQELLPIIHQYFQASPYTKPEVIYYGLDETKSSPDKWETKYKVEFVPTIILIDHVSGAEKGRIVERFTDNISEDLNSILKS